MGEKKPKVEYRVVCARQGSERSHRSHAYPKSSLAKAEQAVIDNNHQSEMAKARSGKGGAGDYYSGEAPWKIEMRVVGAWGDME